MVEHVKIRGKEYPIRIGYYVMKKVQEKTGVSFTESMKTQNQDIAIYETALFAALKSGAFEEKVELDLTLEDMEFALDECLFDFMRAFQSNKFFPKEAEDPEGKPQAKMEKEVKRTKK